MKRRNLVTCSLWLLPLLLLRLLVPAGYMLDVSDGELRIVVCAGASAARLNAIASEVAQTDHTHHEHHHHEGAANDTAPTSNWHGDVSCPFAQLGSVLPTVDLATVAPAVISSDPSTLVADRRFTSTLLKYTPIRGPPAHS